MFCDHICKYIIIIQLTFDFVLSQVTYSKAILLWRNDRIVSSWSMKSKTTIRYSFSNHIHLNPVHAIAHWRRVRAASSSRWNISHGWRAIRQQTLSVAERNHHELLGLQYRDQRRCLKCLWLRTACRICLKTFSGFHPILLRCNFPAFVFFISFFVLFYEVAKKERKKS